MIQTRTCVTHAFGGEAVEDVRVVRCEMEGRLRVHIYPGAVFNATPPSHSNKTRL